MAPPTESEDLSEEEAIAWQILGFTGHVSRKGMDKQQSADYIVKRMKSYAQSKLKESKKKTVKEIDRSIKHLMADGDGQWEKGMNTLDNLRRKLHKEL